MSLLDNIRKGVGVISLSVILALPGCAFRHGDERVSFFGLPFIPVAWMTHETFKDETSNELKSKQEVAVSTFLGNVQMDMKNYGENGKYLGMYKIRIRNVLGEYDTRNITTEIYGPDGKLIKKQQGMPEDVPLSVREKVK